YYDNVYYHGYPSYYDAYPYRYQRPIIHNNIIVVPDQKRVRNSDHVRRRESISPDNNRRRVVPSESNRSIERGSNERRGSSIAPSSSRSSSPAPATRRSSDNPSRRGNN